MTAAASSLPPELILNLFETLLTTSLFPLQDILSLRSLSRLYNEVYITYLPSLLLPAVSLEIFNRDRQILKRRQERAGWGSYVFTRERKYSDGLIEESWVKPGSPFSVVRLPGREVLEGVNVKWLIALLAVNDAAFEPDAPLHKPTILAEPKAAEIVQKVLRNDFDTTTWSGYYTSIETLLNLYLDTYEDGGQRWMMSLTSFIFWSITRHSRPLWALPPTSSEATSEHFFTWSSPEPPGGILRTALFELLGLDEVPEDVEPKGGLTFRKKVIRWGGIVFNMRERGLLLVEREKEYMKQPLNRVRTYPEYRLRLEWLNERPPAYWIRALMRGLDKEESEGGSEKQEKRLVKRYTNFNHLKIRMPIWAEDRREKIIGWRYPNGQEEVLEEEDYVRITTSSRFSSAKFETDFIFRNWPKLFAFRARKKVSTKGPVPS